MNSFIANRGSLLSELSLYPAVVRKWGFLPLAQYVRSNLRAHQRHQQLLAELDVLSRGWLGALLQVLHGSYYCHRTYTDSTTPLESLPVALTEVS